VLNGALVLRLIFEGHRAVGVEYARGAGVERTRAERAAQGI
jgi:hypothetical protein